MSWFVAWGFRVFSHNAFHRVAFQPVLFLFLFAATFRVVVTDHQPIRFDYVAPWAYVLWVVLGFGCPPLSLLSWWLIVKSRWEASALVGIWLRLAADVGVFFFLLTFHLAGVLHCHEIVDCHLESSIFRRYLTASLLVFCASLVTRDVWEIVATNSLSKRGVGRGDWRA